MRQFRNVVTIGCFVLFSAVSLLAVVQTMRAGLPETPSTAGAAVLIGHLSEASLADEPRTTKRQMARRVMRELRDDVDWQPDVAALSAAQRKQLVDNLAEMAQEIIADLMDAYFNLPERARRRFLERQTDEVMRWAVLVDRATRAPGDNAMRMSAMVSLMARLNKWQAEAPAEERKRFQAFQKAFQEQMTERFKRGLQPSG